MDENGNRINRGRFLRQVGVTLAAAMGAGALASHAFAAPGQCCEEPGCGECDRCGGTETNPACICYCDCTGISESYCWPDHCVDNTCIPCPC